MKIMISALALLTISAASACGGTKTQPAPTAGTNAVSATSPAGHGTSTAGGGTNTSGRQTSTARGGSPSGNSSTAESAGYNEVQLGPIFQRLPISFGRVLPGHSVMLPFQLHNVTQQPITVSSVTTGDAAFKASTECVGQELKSDDRCAFSVTFEPTARGNYNSYLAVTFDPGDIELQTGLKGTASFLGQSVGPPASQVAPADSSSSAPTGNSPP
jgi:hypothetical protein